MTLGYRCVRDLFGSLLTFFSLIIDGERCAQTLKSIFDNAKNPDKVIVGLIEEVASEDTSCLEQYCLDNGKLDLHGVKTHTPNSIDMHLILSICIGVTFIQRQTIRADMTKIIAHDEELQRCPRFNQIRLLSKYNIAAKGPTDARALTRKILGNEEFCMQIDAHTSFVKDWDQVAKEEWQSTGNEFAIISTAPARMGEQEEYESWTGSKHGEVPRQCMPKILDNYIPDFQAPADGKAVDLEKPLLSHAWSPAFSFSKCHIEETAPYDPFTTYVMAAEAFPRYARLWTRG